MSRGASDDFNVVTAGNTLEPFLAVELLLAEPNGLRVWTGIGTLDIDDNDYIGLSDLISISPIDETAEIAASGAQFTMSGVPSSMINLALSTEYQGRTVNVYFGLFNVTSGEKETIKIFSGLMDVMAITDDGATSTISMTAENRLIQLERPKVSRYTSQDQKRKYPNDLGFDFVNDMQDKEIKWGG